MLSGQPNRAPPLGRTVRTLLGVALIVWVTPVYFRLPSRVFLGSLLLMLGLIVAYSVIHIVSRSVGDFGRLVSSIVVHALLIALYVAGFSRTPIVGGGKGQLAAVTFFGVSLMVAGIRAVAGCELMAIPDFLLRKDVEVGCPIFSPLDKLERGLRKNHEV